MRAPAAQSRNDASRAFAVARRLLADAQVGRVPGQVIRVAYANGVPPLTAGLPVTEGIGAGRRAAPPQLSCAASAIAGGSMARRIRANGTATSPGSGTITRSTTENPSAS